MSYVSEESGKSRGEEADDDQPGRADTRKHAADHDRLWLSESS